MAESGNNGVWLFFKNFSNKFAIPDFVNGNDRRGSTTASAGSRRMVPYSYDLLSTQDKEDVLSSSNPNLLEMVGGSSSGNANGNNSVKASASMSALKSQPQKHEQQEPQSLSTRFGALSFFRNSNTNTNNSTARNADFNLKTKKFTFPSRVSSCQDQDHDQDEEKSQRKGSASSNPRTNITENIKDPKWLGIAENENEEIETEYEFNKDDGDDGSSSYSSDYEDDDDQEMRNGTRCGICGCEKKYEVQKDHGKI